MRTRRQRVKDAPENFPPCDSIYEVGSYPGGQTFACVKALGHDGDHEGLVWWETADESNYRPESSK